MGTAQLARLALGTRTAPAAQRARLAPAPPAKVLAVQAATCPCGGSCPRCGRLQRAAAEPAPSAGAVPPIVHDVLGSGGTALDSSTRAFMEPRFGRDFSGVRVHTDSKAAMSARAVNALAYTVGSDVVFNRGQYSPASGTGRRLLAHELAHVVQQTGGTGAPRLQRRSIGVLPALVIGPAEDALEQEAERAAAMVDEAGTADVPVETESTGPALQRAPAGVLQRVPAIVGLDEAGPGADLTGRTEQELFECMKGAQADPDECSPNRALTWADFAGTPSGTFSAETSSTVKDIPMEAQKAACLKRVLGKPDDQLRVFQAKLDSSKSWVKARFRNPANPALSGCATHVNECVTWFRGLKRGQTGSMGLTSTPSPNCPAGIVASAAVQATTTDECTTVLGPECARVAQSESQRLLHHEQVHFNLSCVMAKKATYALAAGGTLGAIKIDVADRVREQQAKYDNETNHGCDAASQAAWEKDIGDGLPNVRI
jgi:hypothetical protein